MRMVCYVVDTGSGVLTLFHTRGSPVKQCEYLLCSGHDLYRSKGHDLR